MLVILIVSNLVLLIFAVLFLFKKVLVNFQESKSKAKNVALISCLVVTLFFTFLGGINAIIVNDNINQLKYDLQKPDNTVIVDSNGKEISQKVEIQRQLDSAKNKEIIILIYTVLGYISFGCLWALHKKAVKEISNTETTGSWDLKNF